MRPNPLACLAAAAASEFNDELTMLLNHLEVCLAAVGPRHPAREGLREARRATMRCSAITRRLLEFTRRAGGAARIEPLDRLLDGPEGLLENSFTRR